VKEHPVVACIVAYRRLEKLLGTYLGPYLEHSRRDGRIHCQYGMTVTGRWASREPNLMALPKRTAEGKLFRNGFVAGPGRLLVSWDLDQIEMRVMAHESEDAAMHGIFWRGEDTHTETAMDVFKVTRAAVEADRDRYRLPAKNVGFGVLYGISGYGLWRQLEQQVPGAWSEQECQGFIDRYLGARPGVRAYCDAKRREARTRGEVRDMFGRRRYTWETLSRSREIRERGEREAINFGIQSGAVGIMKVGMALLLRWWEEELASGSILPVLQVHDEIVCEVEEDIVDRVGRQGKEILEAAVPLSVPVIASWKAGKRLGDL